MNQDSSNGFPDFFCATELLFLIFKYHVMSHIHILFFFKESKINYYFNLKCTIFKSSFSIDYLSILKYLLTNQILIDLTYSDLGNVACLS